MEAKVINSFLPDLVTAVSDSVLSVSDQCLAKGLINETVYKRVLESGGTSEDKARTLILAVKKSTETDSRCLEILLNILEQELPFAIRENLLSKIRKELTEKANTCRAVVPLSNAVQQVPLGELSKETTLHQSALLGKFEDSIRQYEHACAEKKLLEERLKVKTEKCEKLKVELKTLRDQNQELASNTQRRIATCDDKIESLKKRIEELQKVIEEQGMQTRRGRNTIVTETRGMFEYLAQQSQQEIQRRVEDHKATSKAKEEMKDREHKLLVQEKELRIRELEAESKQGKKSTDAAEVIPEDMLHGRLHGRHLRYLFHSVRHKQNDCIFHWRDIGSQLGFSTQELDDIQEFQSKNPEPIYVSVTRQIKSRYNYVNENHSFNAINESDKCTFEMLERWLKWYPGDSRGSTNFPSYSNLKQAIINAGFGNVVPFLWPYDELLP